MSDKCCKCGERFDVVDEFGDRRIRLLNNGEYFCGKCFFKYFEKCPVCGEYYQTKDMVVFGSKFYCEADAQEVISETGDMWNE